MPVPKWYVTATPPRATGTWTKSAVESDGLGLPTPTSGEPATWLSGKSEKPIAYAPLIMFVRPRPGLRAEVGREHVRLVRVAVPLSFGSQHQRVVEARAAQHEWRSWAAWILRSFFMMASTLKLTAPAGTEAASRAADVATTPAVTRRVLFMHCLLEVGGLLSLRVVGSPSVPLP